MMKNLSIVSLVFSLALSCGNPKNDLNETDVKQMAQAACLVTGPGIPVCVIGVTLTQIVVTITVAGAVVAVAYFAKHTAATKTVDGYTITYTPTALPAPTAHDQPLVKQTPSPAKSTAQPIAAVTAAPAQTQPIPVAAPSASSSVHYCTCTFSNGVSEASAGDSLMMACGLAIRAAGTKACLQERRGTYLDLTGSADCLKTFGRSYKVGCLGRR